jgi:integrase
MPSGSGVIAYRCSNGDTTYREKFRDAEGRQVQETLGRKSEGWSKRKAEVELRDRLTKVAKRSWRKPEKITLAEYADTWLKERTKKRSLKTSSVRAYRLALDHLKAELGSLPLAEITPRHLAAYTRGQLERLSGTSVNYDLSILRDLYQTAMREELVYSNPVALVERPKATPRRWRILSQVEVPRIAREFTDERARLVFLTLILTGMRRHELCNLTWADVSLIDNAIKVRESKSEAGRRTIAIPPSLAEALWQYRRGAAYQDDGEYVFAHPRLGNKLAGGWFGDELRAACKKAGVEAPERPMHDLRHSCLTHYATEGNPIALMAMAGHRSMASTRVYLHLAGQTFPDEAAALERRFGAGTLYPALYRSDPTSDDLAATEPLAEGASSLA